MRSFIKYNKYSRIFFIIIRLGGVRPTENRKAVWRVLQCSLCFCCISKVCREQKPGRFYIGQVNTTVTGKQCQKWSSNTPHVPSPPYTDDKFPDGSREAANNYCRNPDFDPLWSQGVWCYTMDPDLRREACDVPECGKYYSAARIFSPVFTILG